MITCVQPAQIAVVGSQGLNFNNLAWSAPAFTDGSPPALSHSASASHNAFNVNITPVAPRPGGGTGPFYSFSASMTYNGPAVNCVFTRAVTAPAGPYDTAGNAQIQVVQDGNVILTDFFTFSGTSNFTVADTGGLVSNIVVNVFVAAAVGDSGQGDPTSHGYAPYNGSFTPAM